MALFSAPQKNSRCDQPFGLPRGSIRSLLTILTLLVYFSCVVISMLYGKDIPETLNTITVTMIAFYFGVRSGEGSTMKGKKE